MEVQKLRGDGRMIQVAKDRHGGGGMGEHPGFCKGFFVLEELTLQLQVNYTLKESWEVANPAVWYEEKGHPNSGPST